MLWQSTVLVAGALALLPAPRAGELRLEQLDLSAASSGWGTPQVAKAVTGAPLSIGGTTFEHGLGTHADGVVWVTLDGAPGTFRALVGVDDAAGDERASIVFRVFGNGRELWESGVCRLGQAPREVRLDLEGLTALELVVDDAGDGIDHDHGDWAEAVFEFTGEPPQGVVPGRLEDEPGILTPPPPAMPRLQGPPVVGLRPGSPLLYRIPCSGERPIEFAASELPEGIELDAARGILHGSTQEAGTHDVALIADNEHGTAGAMLKIVVGDRLALTPPMGWNSWYIHYDRISDELMRQAADQMIDTGMADFGYRYVNIDDCWMVKRDSEDPVIGGPEREEDGTLRSNARFPDMRSLADYIHSRGLLAGLYISPGEWTCAGYAGSWQHERQDARTFAEWGFDFLKYDWCSYGRVAGGDTLEDLQRPYRVMWAELQTLDRDIVFNLCQYGMGEVWTWGGEVGHCWRTTGDLGLARGADLPGFFSIGRSNARHWAHARPGAWNDPDYLLIGWVGDAHRMGEGTPTSLTPSEQYSYMSLWCLMAAPLVFSGDMGRLDPFTLNVLCNHEVIEVDQDALGRQGRVLRDTHRELVLLKDLEDGSKALGLFNLSPGKATQSVTWEELGLSGPQRVRDLWRQEDLGTFESTLVLPVTRHGVALVRLWPAR